MGWLRFFNKLNPVTCVNADAMWKLSSQDLCILFDSKYLFLSQEFFVSEYYQEIDRETEKAIKVKIV
jgi:hypothetical protein